MESGFKFNFLLPDAEDSEALLSEAGRSLSPSQSYPLAATDSRRPAAEVVASLVHTEKQQHQLLAPETLVLDDGTQIYWCNPKQVEAGLLKAYGDSSSDSAAVFAHAAHSDLIPSVYEGGLKIWECAHDLLQYLAHQKLLFEGKHVLELGCGFGLPGLYALRKGACVDFQDYNTEVLELATIPNAYLNLESSIDVVRTRCRFFSGDWEVVTDRYLDNTTSATDVCGGRSGDGGGRYDFILTTETIYNPKSYSTLHLIFDRVLATDGQIYVAAKAYYFGVGGTTGDFRDYVLSKGVFSVSTVVASCEGEKSCNLSGSVSSGLTLMTTAYSACKDHRFSHWCSSAAACTRQPCSLPAATAASLFG